MKAGIVIFPGINRERDMASTATDEFLIMTDEDDFLAAFIAIVRENEMSAQRDRAPPPA